MSTTRTGRVLISAALALGASLLTSGVALAAPPPPTPNPGDARATAHPGNATTCAQAGLPGQELTLSGVEDPTGTYVTISAADIPSGDTILGVVVKGGPAYNVYQGLTSWTLLHAPVDPGGQVPTISHWFACGTTGTTTTTTTTTTTAATTTTTAVTTTGTTTTTGSTATTTAGSTTNTGPETSATGTPVAVAVAGNGTNGPNGDNLAYTGFGNAWLLWAGLLLLIVGSCVLALPLLHRRRS